ncbi:MAG: adenylate/guanylate cyclase domain-containing protein [Betaproteobacteria bacterium]|nr:adenylate/guanylate cyclase domain-containing protein [Betaproteobacteria bacterium]
MKQHIVRISLGLLILLVFLGHAARFYQIGFITQLDNIIYDARLRLTTPGGVDDRVVILDIDEKSLAVPELGRWPWGRDKIAALIEKLFDKYGVLIIGFDVVWAERDESSGLKVLDALARKELKDVPQFQSALKELRPQLDRDGLFARTIRGRPVVLGFYLNSDEDARESGVLPEPVLPAGTFAGKPIGFTTWRGYGGNLPEIQASAAVAGHFNPLIDFDGVSRRVPMLAEYKGKYYEPLSLAIVRLLLGMDEAARSKSQTVVLPKVVPGYPPDRFVAKGYAGLEWLEVGPLKIPVDELVSALIPFRGKRNSFNYISLADIYFDKVPVEKLKGRIALIGTSAPGLFDLRSTPVGSVYPGVEIHANLITGMLDRTIKQKPPFMIGAEVILLIIGGVALSILVPFLSPLRATLASLLGLVLFTGLNIFMWAGAGSVLPLASAVLMIAALFALNMSYGYFVESRSKRQFTELFGQYVPPELVDKMAENPEQYSMEGKSEELSVLFSDIRGFTSISESLTPKELSQFINEYLTSMSLVIRNNRGTLDKYIGDAIMAFWGAPVADPDHARQAVLTAMLMQQELKKVREQFKARGWPDIKIGVGVNTGVMSVGDMGSKLRKAYTVMGDAVNLGSRLEGITKQYGVGILCGQVTREKVKDVVWRELDRVRVKGKDEPIAIYEPLGFEGQVEKKVLDELKLWHQGLKAYRAQDWDPAELAIYNLQRVDPEHHLYAVYAERIAHYRKEPPGADWDGVWKFETK